MLLANQIAGLDIPQEKEMNKLDFWHAHKGSRNIKDDL